MNGNTSRLLTSIVAAGAVALSSMGCSVFRKSEPVAAPAPVAAPSAPGLIEASQPSEPESVTRAYNVNGRVVELKFDNAAWPLFNRVLGVLSYSGNSGRPVDGRAELTFALKADANHSGRITLGEVKELAKDYAFPKLDGAVEKYTNK